MPFSSHNFQSREVLLHVVSDLQSLITPFSNGLTRQHERLQKLHERLRSPHPPLRVCLIGSASCGKSSVVNALLGAPVLPCSDSDAAETCFDLTVLPSERDGAEPQLQRRSGDVLAEGPDMVRDWLHVQNINERDRLERREKLRQIELEAHLAATLHSEEQPESKVRQDEAAGSPDVVLHATPLCFEGGFTELPIEIVDSVRNTRTTSTWTAPRTARIKHTRTTFHGDAFVYLIDFRLLRTPEEATALEYLYDPDVRQLVAGMTERLVFVVTWADALINKVNGIDDVHERDSEGLADRFTDMEDLRTYVTKMLKEKVADIHEGQLCIISSRLALHSRLVQPRDGSEVTESPAPLNVIYDYFEISHGSHFMQRIDTIPEKELRYHALATSTEREQMSGVLKLEEALQVLALNSGAMMLSAVCGECMQACQVFSDVLLQAVPLIQEERRVDEDEREQLKKEFRFVNTCRESIAECIVQMRTEVEAVITETFTVFWSERIGELKAVIEGQGVQLFKARQEAAVRDVIRAVRKLREFLKRYVHDRKYVESKVEARERDGPSPSSETQWDFVERSGRDVLKVLSKELNEHVIDLGLSFMHHIKDELQLFLPAIIALCQERRRECIEQLRSCSVDVLRHTSQRTGEKELSIDEAGSEWAAEPIAAPEDRSVNNFLRELPELAAGVFHAAEESAEVRSLDTDACIERTMALVATSWNLVLESKEPADVMAYNSDRVVECLDRLHCRIEDAISGYLESLQDGLNQQEEALEESRMQEEEVVEQRRALQPLTKELQEMWGTLRHSVVWDHDTAVALAQEEGLRADQRAEEDVGASAP